jgi:hypothetical protein
MSGQIRPEAAFLPLPGERALQKIYHIWNKNANRFPLEGIKEITRAGVESPFKKNFFKNLFLMRM